MRRLWNAFWWIVLGPFILLYRCLTRKKIKVEQKQSYVTYTNEGPSEPIIITLPSLQSQLAHQPEEQGVLLEEQPDWTWMGKPLRKLDDGHLYNIVQAVKNGTWNSGGVANIGPGLGQALKIEYKRRGIDVEACLKRNAKYEGRYEN